MKRVFSEEYLINDKPLLAPDMDVSISENDLDSDASGRDESGVMHRVVMREAVRTWEFTYAVLDAEDYSYIISLFKGNASFRFSFRETDGTMATVTAYCAKRNIILRNYSTGEYKNFKFNIIEC